MPKICIVTPTIGYEYEEYVGAKIEATDWAEVDDATLRKLTAIAPFRNFSIIQMPDQNAFIEKTVADFIKMAEEREENLKKEREAADKRKAAAALKKRAKTEQQERELFEQLKAKFELEDWPPD